MDEVDGTAGKADAPIGSAAMPRNAMTAPGQRPPRPGAPRPSIRVRSTSPSGHAGDRQPQCCFVPLAAPSRCSNVRVQSQLLDQLISTGEQGRRDVEPEGFGGLEIDYELKFGGLLDSQVAGLGAF